MIRISNSFLRYISVVVVFGVFPAAFAKVSDAEFKVIKESVVKFTKHKGLTKKDLKSTPLPGIYELTLGARVFYISKDGRYFIKGSLLDLHNNKNLTAIAAGSARLRALKAIDEKEMIIFSPDKGKVKHTITVFTDVECYYCQKLHSQIDDYLKLGIRVRYLAWPRNVVNSPTYLKSVAVWCSKDRRAALTSAKQKQAVEMRTCKNPVEAHMRLGHEMGVNGTPTIVLENGEILPGYVPPATLIKVLDGKNVSSN